MKLFKSALVFIALLALSLTIGASSRGLLSLHSDQWSGIYCGEKKIGYSHTVVNRTRFEGRPVYRRDYTVFFGADAAPSKQLTQHTITMFVDGDFNLIYLVSKTAYTGDQKTTSTVEARFFGDHVKYKLTNDPKIEEPASEDAGKSIDGWKNTPIPPQSDLQAYCTYKLGARQISEGERFRVSYFDEGLLRINSYTVIVGKAERVTIGHRIYDTFVTVAQGEEYDPSWQLSNGEQVKSYLKFQNESWIRESKNDALQGINTTLVETPEDQ